MKNTLKLVCLLLALVTMLGVLSACDSRSNGKKEETTTAGGEEVVTDKYGRVKESNPSYVAEKNFNNGESDAIVNLYICESYKYEFDDESTNGAVLNNEIVNRNLNVEAQLGVELVLKPVKWTDANKTMLTEIDKAVAGGGTDEDSMDICMTHTFYSTGIITQGKATNLASLSAINLDKAWWNQSLNTELMVNGQLYNGVGDLSLSAVRSTFCMFYNRSLFNSTFGDSSENPVDLNDLVEDKEWTSAKLIELVTMFGYRESGDTDGRDDKDTYGFVTSGHCNNTDGFLNGYNVNITEKDEDGKIKFVLGSTHDIEAYDATNDLFYTTGSFGFMSGGGGTQLNAARAMFVNSQSLFYADTFAATDVIGKNMEGTKPYGILPMPLLDELQANTTGYVTTAQEGYSSLIIPTCVKGDRLERVATVLDALCYESYYSVTPAYFEKVLKGRYAPGEEDSDMYDLILNSRVFNFGFVFGYKWGTSNNPLWTWRKQLRTKDVVINTLWSSNNKSWSGFVDDLNDFFFPEED